MIEYVDRRNTNCAKWDFQKASFGEEGLLPLWVADMDFKVPQCVTDALSAFVDRGVFGYDVPPKDYVQSFIDWEEKYHGLKVEKQWVRFSAGVVSGFNWAIQSMTEPGDAMIILTPVYYPFMNAANDNDRKLVTSELINDHGIYSIDFEDFEKKITKNNVKLFLLCSPHNPVGRVWHRDELERLFAICKAHGVFIISDEIHQDITFENAIHIPSLSIPGYEDMMITLTAPSKTFNLAGCQNSFVIIPDEKIREVWDKYTQVLHVSQGNPFGYIAATAAYKEGREWFEEVKRLIYNNYNYVKQIFGENLPDVEISPLEGTYLTWINMGAYLKPEEIEDFMQKKCKLAFDYGSWFGGDRSGSFIRMNLATSLENVEEACSRIIKNLK